MRKPVYCIAFGIVYFAAAAVCSAQSALSSSSVSFRNELKIPVIVQGTSTINNMSRRGPSLTLAPGKSIYDNNVPTGVRTYSIYDASQPSRVLVREQQVPIHNRDQFFSIKAVPGNVSRATLNAEPGP